jgi:hypothetical protein
MTNQIAVQSNNQIQNTFTQDKVALIKATVAKDATDLELQFFVEQCKRTGLDPITRQIYFIKNQGKVQIQTSIDGFRLVAERSGNYEGQTQPQWCGSDGVWKDVWLAKTPPAACKVGVYKKGFREALTAVAIFDEYCQRKNDGSISFMWQKMPGLMIAKVAESLALRKAFPNDLSGLYTQEEMEQSAPEEKETKKEIKTVVMSMPTQTAPQEKEPAHFEATFPPVSSQSAGSDLESYVIPFGKKYKGQRLVDIGLDNAVGFASWLQNDAATKGKELNGQAAEFVAMTEAWIKKDRGLV